MGKQFEILTLILLRNAFKELAHLPEPVSVVNDLMPVLNIAVCGAGALAVYLCLGLYKRIARQHLHFIATADLRMRYVMSKKMLALALFCIFLVTGIRDFVLFVQKGEEHNFFETLYTVLIFADIAMVLIAPWASQLRIGGPSLGCSISQVCSRVEDFEKLNAAKSKNGTVGSRGVTMPITARMTAQNPNAPHKNCITAPR